MVDCDFKDQSWKHVDITAQTTSSCSGGSGCISDHRELQWWQWLYVRPPGVVVVAVVICQTTRSCGGGGGGMSAHMTYLD